VAAAIDHVLGERKRRISGQRAGAAITRDRRRIVRLDGTEIALDILRDDRRLVVQFADDGKKRHALLSDWKPGDPLWSGSFDGHALAVQVCPALDAFDLVHRGTAARARVYTEREAAAARLMPAPRAADTGKVLRCPMPGLVRAIAVAEGQEVKAGETVAIVEAMKMENVLRAERDGVVKAVKAKPGDSLAVDAVIVEFA
jgi:propionyl-CoA carboxylase alpha chain